MVPKAYNAAASTSSDRRRRRCFLSAGTDD
jgi:hypothetical protein